MADDNKKTQKEEIKLPEDLEKVYQELVRGCIDVLTQNVFVHLIPADATISDNSICGGGIGFLYGQTN